MADQKHTSISSKEQEVTNYWKDNDIFQKSIDQRPAEKPYVFYDGPPFATGLPHYGHMVASLMKDVIPRYWTMRGHRVQRRWGWDCHGLPVENMIEKKLDLKTKKDILDFGVDKFNRACRDTVLLYAGEWKKTIEKFGRWVDMERDYKTMDIEYMESVWWVFKQLWDKNLIYQGYKSMHICPRCETTLSNFEVTLEYKDIKDISVYPKFKLTNAADMLGVDGDIFALAWTTTPWTLPGNVLLAVGADIEYVLVSVVKDEKPVQVLLAKDLVDDTLGDSEHTVEKTLKGSDLVGLTYEPLFPYYSETENAFHVVAADFVSTESGTGIVHVAPAFGDDDYSLGREHNVGWVQHVGMNGAFAPEVADFAGLEVKPKEDHQKTDIEIIKWLAHNGKLFAKKKIEHSYPHCWRCDTPLLNYATSSWFVKVTAIKDEMIANNAKINWVPDHIKDGRFGKWLENARDWAISRSRFWGTPLPVWRCQQEDCAETIVYGSVEELSQAAEQNVADLHKEFVDAIEIPCKNCSGMMKRIPEVLDCWFESGSMPYAQKHYPFENKESLESGFPAEFIAEGQDQTRGWFYTLHILATALSGGKNPSIPCGGSSPAFKNVIVNGIVLAEDGRKMSKRLQNYPDPLEILEQYGADALRYYLVTSPVMHAQSLNFSEKGVREMYNKVVNTVENILAFYLLFAEPDLHGKPGNVHVLDRWVVARLHETIQQVTSNLEAYKLAEASRPLVDFITDVSQWYVRRSRDRFKSDDEADMLAAKQTLKYVLVELSKIMAPFTPFIAERVYRALDPVFESVHLDTWPEYDPELHNMDSLAEMTKVRKVIEMGLALRSEHGMKVRQVLAGCAVTGLDVADAYKQLIADELNVKHVAFNAEPEWPSTSDSDVTVALDVTLTDELKMEGALRELGRHINSLRKNHGLKMGDAAEIKYHAHGSFAESVISGYIESLGDEAYTTLVEDASVEGTVIKLGDDEVHLSL